MTKQKEIGELLGRLLQPVKTLQTERRGSKVIKKWVLTHYMLSIGAHQHLMEELYDMP